MEDDFALGELTMEGTSEKTEQPAAKNNKPGAKKADDSLPDLDLDLDGLELNSNSLIPAGSAAGKKLRPAVKTGTALDDFDIDLGELMSGMKK